MSKSHQEQLARIKANYPRAYERWTDEEEQKLTSLIQQEKPIEAIANIIKRQPNAIRIRLHKLEQRGDPTNSPTGLEQHEQSQQQRAPNEERSLSLTFLFTWTPVLTTVDTPYLFPKPLTDYMKHRYKWPAVYRWHITPLQSKQSPILYIGHTKKLCPDRLNGYLKPATSSTNQRLHGLLTEYHAAGYTVSLDILQQCATQTNHRNKMPYQLSSQTHRMVAEEMLINHYKQQDITLLNG